MIQGQNYHFSPILVADDDADDRQLIKEALTRCQVERALYFVADGQAVIDFLRRTGPYAARPESDSPRPALILLDLNMPRKNGARVLEEIKRDPAVCSIPVIVFTTSGAEEDVARCYSLGANSFVTKPLTFDGLIKVMGDIREFWFHTSTLPHEVEK